MRQCEGQLSLWGVPEPEPMLEPGAWVERSECGKELTFEELKNHRGRLVICECSTIHHERLKVVEIIGAELGAWGKERLVYKDGRRQKNSVDERFFIRKRNRNKTPWLSDGWPHYYKIKGDSRWKN